MPLRVSNVKHNVVHHKNREVLFKKPQLSYTQVKFDNKDIIKNSNFNFLHKFLLNLLDKMNPLMKNHSKVARVITNISEKMLKNSKELQVK